MSEKETVLVHDDGWMFELRQRPGGALVFEVVVGTIALHEISFVLDEAEAGRWQREGKVFLDSLARQVVANPAAYEPRTRKIQV